MNSAGISHPRNILYKQARAYVNLAWNIHVSKHSKQYVLKNTEFSFSRPSLQGRGTLEHLTLQVLVRSYALIACQEVLMIRNTLQRVFWLFVHCRFNQVILLIKRSITVSPVILQLLSSSM